jgi:hypothetical protein
MAAAIAAAFFYGFRLLLVLDGAFTGAYLRPHIAAWAGVFRDSLTGFQALSVL